MRGPWSKKRRPCSMRATMPSASTNVRVYGATPEVVYEGYTPGYLGTVVTPAAVVNETLKTALVPVELADDALCTMFDGSKKLMSNWLPKFC